MQRASADFKNSPLLQTTDTSTKKTFHSSSCSKQDGSYLEHFPSLQMLSSSKFYLNVISENILFRYMSGVKRHLLLHQNFTQPHTLEHRKESIPLELSAPAQSWTTVVNWTTQLTVILKGLQYPQGDMNLQNLTKLCELNRISFVQTTLQCDASACRPGARGHSSLD